MSRIVVMAQTMADARAYVADVYRADTIAAIVTPRSMHGVRGVTASHVVQTDAWADVTPAIRLRMLDVVQPALAVLGCNWCRAEVDEQRDELRAEGHRA